MEQKFIISPAPHLKSKNSIPKMMFDTILALIPAGIGGIIFFGWYAGLVILVSVVSSIIAEWFTNVLRKQQTTITNLSCIITGILIAYTLPPRIPLWIAAVGAFIGIVFGKQIYGGLGFNPFNPALIGRAFVHIAFPQNMADFSFDTVTTATPLTILKHFPEQVKEIPELVTLLIGNYSSAIGESSVILLILGFVYLVIKRHIFPLTTIMYILTVTVFTLFVSPENLGTYIFSGGLFLGAIFMVTDPVTTPVSPKGKLIFAFGCGILTCIIRFWGSYPEGVCFSILLMNLLTPLIDNYTIIKKFGYIKK